MQRRPRRIIGGALLAGASAWAGCSARFGLPSAEEEAALGRELSARLEREIGVLPEPSLQAWVGELGGRLAAASSDREAPWHFAVADMAEPNVVTLPGRHVYVSRGLLILLDSEAELAAALAHGMGHGLSGPVVPRGGPGPGGEPLRVLGRQALRAAGGRAGSGRFPLAPYTAAGLIASFDEEQEERADAVAQRLLAGAGYDPLALARLLQDMAGAEDWRIHGAGLPTFLQSHPAGPGRLRSTELRARAQPSGPLRALVPRPEFLARLEGLAVGRDPARGLLEGERFLHGPLGFVVDFPAGWISEGLQEGAGAHSPRGDAFAVVEIQTPLAPPVEAARRFAARSGVVLGEGVELEIGGWPAYRSWAELRMPEGKLDLDLTWIAHPEATLQIVGLTPTSRSRVYAESLRLLARGVRPLTRGERRALHETRLRVVNARAGEELVGLCRRTKSAWSPDEVAMANGLPREVRLDGDEPVKIAVSQRLVGAP